jgi:hypothetical protein
MEPNKVFHFAYQSEDTPMLLSVNIEAETLTDASAIFEQLKPKAKLVYAAPLSEADSTEDFKYTFNKMLEKGLTKKSVTLVYQRMGVDSEVQNMKCIVAEEQAERFLEENKDKFVKLIAQ